MKPAVEVSIPLGRRMSSSPVRSTAGTADAGTGYKLRPSAALLVGPGSGRGRLANRPHERTQRFRRLSTVIRSSIRRLTAGWPPRASPARVKPVIPGMALPPMILLPCWPMAQLARRTVIPTPRPALPVADRKSADDDDLPTCGLTLRSAVRAADPVAASRRLRSIRPGDSGAGCRR